MGSFLVGGTLPIEARTAWARRLLGITLRSPRILPTRWMLRLRRPWTTTTLLEVPGVIGSPAAPDPAADEGPPSRLPAGARCAERALRRCRNWARALAPGPARGDGERRRSGRSAGARPDRPDDGVHRGVPGGRDPLLHRHRLPRRALDCEAPGAGVRRNLGCGGHDHRGDH